MAVAKAMKLKQDMVVIGESVVVAAVVKKVKQVEQSILKSARELGKDMHAPVRRLKIVQDNNSRQTTNKANMLN